MSNRLTETRDGASAAYTYGLNADGGRTHQLLKIVTGGVEDRFFHDASGNLRHLRRDDSKIRYTYDAANRLSQIRRDAAGGSTALTDLRYDGRSFLSRSTSTPVVGVPVPSSVTRPTYSSTGVLYHRSIERSARPSSRRELATEAGDDYVFYFARRPVAQLVRRESTPPGGQTTVSSSWTYVTTDHLGAPVLATDEAGDVVWRGGFEPFGEDFSGAREAGMFLRFPGQWQDETWEEASPETGEYYNVHRWYQPSTGQYTRTDPAGLITSGLDLYGYARQTPTVAVDPLGLATCILISGMQVGSVFGMDFYLGDHASVFITGDCENDGDCKSPAPLLYDPNGGFPYNFPGSGHSYILNDDIEGWGFSDYFDYQCEYGSDILELYCFNTTCCEEKGIVDQIGDGGSGAFGCSLNTTRAVNGIGPFQDLGSGATPALLRRAVNRILRRGHEGSVTTLRCPVN